MMKVFVLTYSDNDAWGNTTREIELFTDEQAAKLSLAAEVLNGKAFDSVTLVEKEIHGEIPFVPAPERFPDYVVDGEGDSWYHEDSGLYSLSGASFASRYRRWNKEQIKKQFGIDDD